MRHPLLALVLPLVACGGVDERAETELLIENVRLLDRADADAVLVRGERIVAVGPRERVAGLLTGTPERIVDGRGGLLLPGFHDAHSHPLGGALARDTLDLAGAKSLAEVQARLRAWAAAHPGDWIEGKSWSYDVAPEPELTAAALDQAVADRPVVLTSYDGHTTWVNSEALRRAGLSGSGLLKEGEGSARLDAAVPAPPPAEQKEALRRALEEMVARGITAVGAMNADPETELALLASLEAEGRLPLRVFAWLPWETDLDRVVELRKQHQGGRLHVIGIKGFLDGVLETGTAFLLEPYAGPDAAALVRGEPLIEPGALEERVAACAARGIPVALHSIGDAATRLALDVFARAGRGLRHRLEHLELVHPEDHPRFAELGVVASMQPYHAIPSDGDPDSGAWSEHVGKARLPLTFPWRRLKDAGATLAFGSDWDVFTFDPLHGLAVAVTRRNQSGHPPAGWYAHQALTFREAVEAYTGGSARAVGWEGQLGRIEPDFLADLVLLDPQVKPDDPTTLWSGKVRAVVVGGRVVE